MNMLNCTWQLPVCITAREAFEGLKAYRCPDGKVRVFRMDENAARLQSTCRGIMMPEVPTEMFEEMVKKVVRLNQEYIPALREWCNFVCSSFADWYKCSSGRTSFKGIFVHDIRYTSWTIF